MFRDFLQFLRHTLAIIQFIKGVLLALLLVLLACAALLVLAEGLRVAEALYFVLVTALTIGYGDITPTSPLGRVVSVATGLIGIVITGIVVAVVVRALAMAIEEKRREQDPEP